MSDARLLTPDRNASHGRAWFRLAVLLAVLVCAACEAGGGTASRVAAQEGPAPPLSDAAFASLVSSLSEEGGYFDTDNLISNETSYLHVLGPLRGRGVRGGAYLGVGPAQNFSYIAEVRPRIAFIVDIRRDNLLQQLLFKALFEVAPTRIEYLSLLVGREPPGDPGAWEDRPLEDLVGRIDGAADAAPRARRVVDSAVVTLGVPLDGPDLATIARFHETFIGEGLDLRFRSHGRSPRPYYPTLRRLLLERDLTGVRGSFLADPDDYRFLRELQERNLVIPVVGDLAGDHAVRAVGELLRRRGEALTVLYTSNVEFYLFRAGTFDRFADNVASLPLAEGGVLVRSYFPSFLGSHPDAVPGYWSTQSLQTLESFVETVRAEGYRGYWDLVTRHALDPDGVAR